MRTTFNINFLCRQGKVTKSGKAPVEMSIIINGRRTYLNLPRKEDPKEFNKLIHSKKTNDLKEFLELMYHKVLTAETEIVKQGRAVTPAAIKEYIQNGCTNCYTVEDMFDSYLNLLKKRVGITLSPKVYRKYELIKEQFCTYFSKDKQATEITNEVINGFYADLCSKYKSTTAANTMTKLKTIVIYALDNSKITINPFNGIKISKRTKEVEFLTTEEVNRIKAKELNGRLSKVRDLFLFQCFTGLAYTDMANLTKDDFQINEYGQYYIKKNRQKTGVCFLSVLLEEAKTIIMKYQFQLPVLSNQKYNSYLKEIADICSITKPLHTHIGRHTAATYLLNKGIPIETVAKILGHSNIKQTQHYAKLIDRSVFEVIAKLDRS